MLNLVLKDIALRRRTLMTAVLICIVNTMLLSDISVFIYMLEPPFIMYMLLDESSFYDYRYTVNVMFNSLPIRKRDLVISKYIDSIIFLIIGIIVTITVVFAFRNMGNSHFFRLGKLINIEMFNKLMKVQSIIISSVVSTTLLICIYLPIYFKCQYMKVRGIFAIVSMVICVMPIIFIKIVGNANAYKFIIYLNNASKWIVMIVAAVTLFFIVCISLKLSMKFYEDKDL